MATSNLSSPVYTCKQCGGSFVGRKKKFCTRRCALLAYGRLKEKAPRHCKQCNAVFMGWDRQIFCTKNCGAKYGRLNHEWPWVASWPWHRCQHCHKSYQANPSNRVGLFCSRPCNDAYLAENGRSFHIQRTCPQCMNIFTIASSSQRVCTQCSEADASAKAARYQQARPCQHCAQPFLPKYLYQRYCTAVCADLGYRAIYIRPSICTCKHCAKDFTRDPKQSSVVCPTCQAHKKHYTARAAKLQERVRRRARRAMTAERFSDHEIFERDQWRCRLCDLKISRQVSPNHKRYATIDHILPLSLGGHHTRTNVQTACRFCNGQKHNRVGDGIQLVLVAG